LFYSFTLFSPHILYLIYMSFFFLFTLPLPLISPLFPYTTLFRSFSSLTLVGYGNISNEVSDWRLENLSWESSIHLNNMVSIYIWELLTSSSLSLYLPLESNPSLRVVVVDNDSKLMEYVKVNRNRKS